MRFADSFRAARWVRLVNLLLQAVLFLTLFAGLNYVALNHSWRFDLTASHRYSLSPETESYLDRLERDVQIFVTFTEDSESPDAAQAYRDLDGLLREYVYRTRAKQAGHGRVIVRFVDVYAQRRVADELELKQPNLVLVKCDNNSRRLLIDELYTIKNRTHLEKFKGEAAMTEAILDVSNPEKKKIYFVQGHGELLPDDVSPEGLSILCDQLRQRNFALAGLDLRMTRKVPDDASLLVIAGPRSPFQPFEEELLRNYLGIRAGRIILMVGPGQARIGLEKLLFEWGMFVWDNKIFDQNTEYLTETGELRLRHFLPHPITQSLIDYSLPLLVGPARVVMEDLGRSSDDGLSVKTLVATSQTAWGETNYDPKLGIPPEYTQGQDPHGQLGVLVISERVKPAERIDFSVRGGRLATLGTAELVTNGRISNLGNLTLFLQMVNWEIEGNSPLSIPARSIQRFQLSLSQEELLRLRLGLLFIVPGAVAILGLLVYWTRRA